MPAVYALTHPESPPGTTPRGLLFFTFTPETFTGARSSKHCCRCLLHSKTTPTKMSLLAKKLPQPTKGEIKPIKNSRPLQAIAIQLRQQKIQTSATPVNAALQSVDRHLQQVVYNFLHRKYRWSAYRMEIQQLTIAFLLKRQELLKHVKQVIFTILKTIINTISNLAKLLGKYYYAPLKKELRRALYL